MRRGATSSLQQGQAIRQSVDEERRLAALCEECHALRAELDRGARDVRALRRLEGRLSALAGAVSRHIRIYASLRGGPTREEETVWLSLAASQCDLAWLRSHHRPVPDQQMMDRLGHALRAISSAATLLRWSYA